MLHPDAPETVTSDPDEYARWRVANADEEEVRLLTKAERLAFFRDEWYESLETPDQIATENAEIELHLLREKGGQPQ